MSLGLFKFIQRLVTPAPVDSAIAEGDRLDEALNKLQGQVSARLPLAGGTLSGALAMGNFPVSGVKTVGFNGEFDVGNSGTAATMTLTNGQKQKVTLNGVTPALTITTTGAPVGHYQLRIIQDATGGRVPSFVGLSASRWLGSATAPGVNLAVNGETVLSLFWDGANLIQSLAKVGAA